MLDVNIIVDSIPTAFGHASHDWAGLFVSRLYARPLIDRALDDQYRFRAISSLHREDRCDWTIELDTSTGLSTAALLDDWRASWRSGNRLAFRFLERATAVDRNTLRIRTRHPCESIRPFLDSPWLWANMSRASRMSVGEGPPHVRVLRHGRQTLGPEVVLSTDALQGANQVSHRIFAGFPSVVGANGGLRDLDIEFALIPGESGVRGPLDGTSLIAIRRLVAQRGLLAPLREHSRSSDEIPRPVAGTATRIAFTDFYPNRLVVHAMQRELARAGVTVRLERARYTEKYAGYSRSADADLVPIVPNNSACTDVPRRLLACVGDSMDDRKREELVEELEHIDGDVEGRSAQHRAAVVRDDITAISGFGVLGRYRGYFHAEGSRRREISSAGFTDLERYLQ